MKKGRRWDAFTRVEAIVAVGLAAVVAGLFTWRGLFVLLPATQADVRELRADLDELRAHVMAQPIVTVGGGKTEVRSR